MWFLLLSFVPFPGVSLPSFPVLVQHHATRPLTRSAIPRRLAAGRRMTGKPADPFIGSSLLVAEQSKQAPCYYTHSHPHTGARAYGERSRGSSMQRRRGGIVQSAAEDCWQLGKEASGWIHQRQKSSPHPGGGNWLGRPGGGKLIKGVLGRSTSAVSVS